MIQDTAPSERICYLCEQPFSSTWKRKKYYCPTCLKTVPRRVQSASLLRYNLQRATKRGLPATLTVKQWMKTLDDFTWLCAYCQIRPYQCIEHFFPLELGGGTTPGNIVPACFKCNARKVSYLPQSVLDPDIYLRLSSYLKEREVTR